MERIPGAVLAAEVPGTSILLPSGLVGHHVVPLPSHVPCPGWQQLCGFGAMLTAGGESWNG